jgi:hypothetical protein
MCSLDWTALGTWALAVITLAAVVIALRQPALERKAQRAQAFARQKAALVCIGGHIVETIKRVRRRATENTLKRVETGWLTDELRAATRIAEDVDLTTLVEKALVQPMFGIQEAARSTERRFLRATEPALESGLSPDAVIPLNAEDYAEALKRAEDNLANLNAAAARRD